MNDKSIFIIGAGITGIFAAYYLNKAGYEVTLFDKSDGTDNCSYGNAGMIVPSHVIPLASPGTISAGLRWMLDAESPFYVRPRLDPDLVKWGWKFKKYSTRQHVENAGSVLKDLLSRSRELFTELNEQLNVDFGFTEKGLYMFCKSEQGLEKEAEAAGFAKRLGVPATIMNKEEVAEKAPHLRLDIAGAVFYPDDAHLHPGALMDGLKEYLISRGVAFHFNTKITRFLADGQRIKGFQSADGRTFEAGKVVLCNGIWSHSLGKTFGKNLLMQGGKGYSITLQNPPVLPVICGILAERKVTLTPMLGTLRFAGTMEITGSDMKINQKKVNGLKKAVCEYLPQFTMSNFADIEVWAGLRPIAPDGLPYVGKCSTFENLYISTGHAMMGMSLAPSCGLLISELITNGSSELYHPMISPDRFN